MSSCVWQMKKKSELKKSEDSHSIMTHIEPSEIISHVELDVVFPSCGSAVIFSLSAAITESEKKKITRNTRHHLSFFLWFDKQLLMGFTSSNIYIIRFNNAPARRVFFSFFYDAFVFRFSSSSLRTPQPKGQKRENDRAWRHWSGVLRKRWALRRFNFFGLTATIFHFQNHH